MSIDKMLQAIQPTRTVRIATKVREFVSLLKLIGPLLLLTILVVAAGGGGPTIFFVALAAHFLLSVAGGVCLYLLESSEASSRIFYQDSGSITKRHGLLLEVAVDRRV